MIKVSLHLYGQLKAGVGSREIVLELAEGTELKDLPVLLGSQYGERVFHLLGGEKPFGHWRVLINGRDHFTLQGMRAVLVAGDTIAFISPVAGG